MHILKVHLTQKLMKSIITGEECRYCDTDVSGLQVWVGKRSVSYYLRKRNNGKEYTFKLGNHPDLTLAEAREKALDRLGALANHGDINAPTGRKHPLVSDAIEYYLSSVITNPRTNALAKSCLKEFLRYNDTKISDITKEDIERVHKAMHETPGKANVAVKMFMSAIHHLQRKMGEPVTSILYDFKWYKLMPRKRYIKEDEAPRFFNALEQVRNTTVYGMIVDLFYMLLYTGARKENVCEMLLEEIDENGNWTIPAEKFKGGKHSHKIQLGDVELGIIDKYRNGRKTGYVFPHEKSMKNKVAKALKKVLEIAKMDDFRVHDIRRTIGTWMLSNGTPIAVVSKKLGHSSISITEQVYAHILPSVSQTATDDAINAMRKYKGE